MVKNNSVLEVLKCPIVSSIYAKKRKRGDVESCKEMQIKYEKYEKIKILFLSQTMCTNYW